jgi:hypothetical protein
MKINIHRKQISVEGAIGEAGAVKDNHPQNSFISPLGRNEFMASQGNRKDYLINGSFQIFQRGQSNVAPDAKGIAAADRWKLPDADQRGSVERTTCQFGVSPWMYKTTSDPSNGYNIIYQSIEDVTQTGGKLLTLSFKAKVDGSPTLRLEIQQFFGSGGSGTSTLLNEYDFFDVPDNDNWHTYQYTFRAPEVKTRTIGSEGVEGTYMNILFGPHNSGGARNSNTFYVTDVQLEDGPRMTPFELADRERELSRCQRYYTRFAMGNTEAVLPVCAVWDTQNAYGSMPLPVEMRATPTFRYPGGNNWIFYSAGNSYTPNYITSLGSNKHTWGIHYRNSATNWTSGNTIYAREQSTSAYIAFDAEF